MANDSQRHRLMRDQALDHSGTKIENKDSPFPVIESLGGLFESFADAHKRSVQLQRTSRLPNNNEGLGFDRHNRDVYDPASMAKNPGSWKVRPRWFHKPTSEGNDD
jgi:hypothetical protein